MNWRRRPKSGIQKVWKAILGLLAFGFAQGEVYALTLFSCRMASFNERTFDCIMEHCELRQDSSLLQGAGLN